MTPDTDTAGSKKIVFDDPIDLIHQDDVSDITDRQASLRLETKVSKPYQSPKALLKISSAN